MIVVILDFLVPATVLGMVGPVVTKMAVEQARRTGSAMGDVYFCGAIGSIAGTFLAGFVLMYLAPSSTIVLLVAAALALLAAALFGQVDGLVLGLLTALLLGLGSIEPLVRSLGLGAIALGSYQINFLALAGNVTALLLGLLGLSRLFAAQRQYQALGDKTSESVGAIDPDAPRPSLSDLAILAFLASLGFMALEMVAGRMVSRHLGSSIYGWTSVIAVLLAGLSLGNFLGGRAANLVKNEKQASWLFLAASVLVLSILLLESPPRWLRERIQPGSSQECAQRGDHLVRAEAAALAGHHSVVAVPGPSGHHPGLLPPRGLDGDGQPGRGEAGGGPPEALQADRHGHRAGVCLGHGRQHPGHLPDGVRPDRRHRHQGSALAAGRLHGVCGNRAGIGLARRLGGRSARAVRDRVHSAEHVPEDGRGVGNPRGKGKSRNQGRRFCLDRRK